MADVLIFSAHPDDAEFGMGGTLLKLAKRHKVVNIILTRGEAGTYGTPEVREQEAKQAALFAKAEVEFLDFMDNHVEDTVENAKKLALVIRKYSPRVIFAPYHTNNFSHKDGAAHPDHCALGSLVLKAARFAKFKNAAIADEAHTADKLVYYMVPKYQKPSFIVDVSEVVEEIRNLWQCHKSQLQMRQGKLADYLLVQRRAIGLSNGVEHAEAFIMEEPLRISPDDVFRI